MTDINTTLPEIDQQRINPNEDIQSLVGNVDISSFDEKLAPILANPTTKELLIKALKENPWKEFETKLKKGDIIKGVVIKFNKHGALVSIKEGVAGLVHNSLFGTEAALRAKLELGKTYNFQVTLFEPKDQRMTLAFLEEKK